MARPPLDPIPPAPPSRPTRSRRLGRAFAPVGVAIGVVVAAATLASCSSGPAAPTDPTLKQGYEVFARNCAACHGTGGGGGSAPRLIGIADRMSEAQEIDTITNGVDGTAMPAWGGRLSAEEIAAVAAYTRSLTPTE